MCSFLTRSLISASTFIAFITASPRCEWLENGTPVTAAASWQYRAAMTSDGAGGTIVAWEDNRNGQWDIYCQRIDSLGSAVWLQDGVPICTASGYQGCVQLVMDGAGCAIIVWQDHRSGGKDIYAQQIDAAGVIHWSLDGIVICTATGDQLQPSIISDGLGGAYIAWKDYRTEKDDVYMQRVGADGSIKWAPDGIAISLCPVPDSAAYPPQYARMAPDDRGNSLVVWGDWRSGNARVYAQKVDTLGTALWTPNGSQVSGLPVNALDARIIHDGHGGAIIAWRTERMGDYDTDIYAQRIDSMGTVAWDSIGVPVSKDNGGTNMRPCIAPDGCGGAFVAWEDSGFDTGDIAAQRLNAAGDTLWRANGIYIHRAASYQTNPQIIADNSNCAIIAWQDYLNDGIARVQKVNGNGNIIWQPDGIPLSNMGTTQSGGLLVSDDRGGAIISWTQIGVSYDVYCTKIDAIGHLPPMATLLLNSSSEVLESSIIIRWTLSEIDSGARFTIMKSCESNGAFEEIHSPEITRDGATYTYIDTDCNFGESYCYRIEVAEGEDRQLLFETELISVPSAPLTLYQNVPNPFNPATRIGYYLPHSTHVSLSVFDAAGRNVASLVDARQEKGRHEVEWNARGLDGNPVSSGVYFCRLVAGKERRTIKLLLLK